MDRVATISMTKARTAMVTFDFRVCFIVRNAKNGMGKLNSIYRQLPEKIKLTYSWPLWVLLAYISTRVTTPCSLLVGSLLNCTKLGVSFLMVLKMRQAGFRVEMSSMP